MAASSDADNSGSAPAVVTDVAATTDAPAQTVLRTVASVVHHFRVEQPDGSYVTITPGGVAVDSDQVEAIQKSAALSGVILEVVSQ